MNEAALNKVRTEERVRASLLKVLILTWEFPPNVVGGLSKHVFGLSNQLAQMGVEVHVLTAGTEGLIPYEKLNEVHIHRVKPLNEQDDQFLSWIGGLNVAMAVKAVELQKEIKFKIIHAHDWLVGSAAISIKNLFRLPLLTTIHATEHGRNSGIHNEMQRFIHEKEHQLVEESDKIIVCSEYMKEELNFIFNNCIENVAVIPNGVDHEMMKTVVPIEHYSISKNKKLIFSIGRIVKEKGFETIIDSAVLVKKKNLNVFFAVAGKGPMLENYRRRVIEKKLEEQLAFIGYITDEEKNAFILQSDMMVFPSLYEPFGIVALESMIQEKPTIASDIGGLKGIITHMETGLLMVPGNADSLLEQISYLLTNPQKAHEIGSKGKQMVKSLYSWLRVAEETKQIMEDVVNENRI